MGDNNDTSQETTVWGRFVGRLMERPQKEDGFTALDLKEFSGPRGVSGVHVLLDPDDPDTKGVAKEALKWSANDLVQLEGEVFGTKKCDCCDRTLLFVGAFEWSRITGTA